MPGFKAIRPRPPMDEVEPTPVVVETAPAAVAAD
jgi:hypothetical protein